MSRRVESLERSISQKNRRKDYIGPDIEGFLFQSAQKASAIWEEVNLRRSDANQNITTQDYVYLSQQVGKLGGNVLHLAAAWSHSADIEKKRVGGLVLWSQSLDPVLKGIDKLKEEYPGVNFDEENLIQEGIEDALDAFGRIKGKQNVPNILQRIGENTFKSGSRIVREQTQEYSSVPEDELERGQFITANLDSVVDYFEEAARLDLRRLMQEALATISPREARVIEKRFLNADMQTATLEDVGRDEGVTRERIRQIEAKALRKLRHPSRTKKFIDYNRAVSDPTRFKDAEAREQEPIRVYWNGVVNAVHFRDVSRVRRLLARLKISLVPSTAFNSALREGLNQQLDDPGYPHISGSELADFLKKYTRNPALVLQQLIDLEFGEGYLSKQVRAMERIAGLTHRDPMIVPGSEPERPKAEPKKEPPVVPVAPEEVREPPKASEGSTAKAEELRRSEPEVLRRPSEQPADRKEPVSGKEQTARPEVPPVIPVEEIQRPSRIREVVDSVAAFLGLQLILNGLTRGGVGFVFLSDMSGLSLRLFWLAQEPSLRVEIKRLGAVDFKKPVFSDPNHGLYKYSQINRIVKLRFDRKGIWYNEERETLFPEKPQAN